ncbi:hypothetical protein KQ887_15890, partial [Listeria monocytogenes]|nr:hypothetical protein [Listeria monocytogenes]
GAGIAFQPENVQAASEAMIAMAKMAPTQRQEMGLNGQKAYWRDLSFASALAETENVLERAIASDAR